MNRTSKETRALGTFGVYRRPGDSEIEILAIADDYREQLCQLYQERHEALIDFRNAEFPELFAAMAEKESAYAQIGYIEGRIKALHSELRDRNVVTAELEAELVEARERLKRAVAAVNREKTPWLNLHKEFSAWWKLQADWKNVKSLPARRKLYEKLRFPRALAGFGRLRVQFDLRERDLNESFSSRLHPAIRGEIKEASQPKLGKDKPGIRYRYGRAPEPRPWEKLTIAFSGGLTVADALSGKSRQLSLEPLYTNHKASGDETVYRVRQQIGTSEQPRFVEYDCKFHVPLAGVIQRWSLVVRDRKRYVIPIITERDFSKPIGDGSFSYRLSWTVRSAGIEVAHFSGAHVNERLVLPSWLVERRMRLKEKQAAFDIQANELLALRGALPETGKRQGVDALEDYVAAHPDDAVCSGRLSAWRDSLERTLRTTQRAARCIEKIYETVARRVCERHSGVVKINLDIAKIKRYDTRDLLKEDKLPPKSREIMHAVAPGKLKALIEGYGLASVEEADQPPEDSRGTDLFTSYVARLASKTGRKQSQPRNRSQAAAETLEAQ